MKTFTVAGVSTLNGVCKVRFANDTKRGDVLTKNGHTDVKLVELSTPCTQVEAALALQQIPMFQTTEILAVLDEFLSSKLESTKKSVEIKPAVISDEVVEDEEAPF